MDLALAMMVSAMVGGLLTGLIVLVAIGVWLHSGSKPSGPELRGKKKEPKKMPTGVVHLTDDHEMDTATRINHGG